MITISTHAPRMIPSEHLSRQRAGMNGIFDLSLHYGEDRWIDVGVGSILSAFFIMFVGFEGVCPRLTPRTWATFSCGFLSAVALAHLLLDR